MADISTLVGLNPVEQIDTANYAVNQPKKGFQLPKHGVYTLQAPAAFPPTAYGVSKAGALTVQIDPTIVGPTNEGTEVRFVKVSGKVYKRNGENVSQIGDYLNACGLGGVFATPAELADAVESTANLTFQAELDWKAYADGGNINIEGMDNFPLLEDGSRQQFVDHPTLKDDQGRAKRVFANLYIRNFVGIK